MRYIIQSYIRFFYRSTNKHGVHSPFVYKFVTKCLNDKTNYSEYKQMQEYRLNLYRDKNEITVKDFGAGSRVFKNNTRQISKIARVAGMTSKRQKLLYRITKYLNCQNILELGTSLGLGTLSMALASKGKVTTVEGCPETLKTAQNYFQHFNIQNVWTVNENFTSFLSELPASEKYDLIYIDGNHSGTSTLHYFELLLNHIHNDTLIIFDDIYWSKEMTNAWKEIIKNPKVRVSIDTFQWGFVFFRNEQQKEHFTIRV